MSEIIGQKIQLLRKLKGLTQEDLADKTNLSVRTIQRIEKGDVDPRTYTLNVLAEALEVEIGDLLPESETNPDKVQSSSGWNAILHLSGFFCLLIPPLVIWLWKRDEYPEMRGHAIDVLNFQISMWIYMFGASLLIILIIGLPILILLGIYSSFIVIINTLKVLNGNSYRYPLSISILKTL